MKKLIITFFFIFALLTSVYALDLELTRGTRASIPLAIVPFKGESTTLNLSAQIEKDLNATGVFRFIDTAEIAQKPSNALNTNFSLWKRKGVNYLLVGDIKSVDGGKVSVAFQLLDPVTTAHILVSQEYTVSQKHLRALAHHISDLVFEQITGMKGVFSTKLAYVLVKRGQPSRGRYELMIADYDGANPKPLLISSEPIMSPSWSPGGKRIAFVSFENKRSEIYVVDIASGQRQRIANHPGINGAPSWSPDGSQLALVLSKTGEPKIYLYDLKSRQLQQKTFGLSIDTEPSFSPDGRRLVFTSSRGGSPQIYGLNLQTGAVKRLTYSGKYNSSAHYLPDMKRMVLLHRQDKKYQIAITDIDTQSVSPVTFSTFDESPSIAPNGQMIVYATKSKGRGLLRISSADGSIRLRLTHPEGDLQEPAWSPFG